MTFGGWCTFLISNLTVLVLFSLCIAKVLSLSNKRTACAVEEESERKSVPKKTKRREK